MLELKEIRKVYPAGDGLVQALQGISLQFRRSEFVSILGPSGCGKTTMLNIIGGLDQYTSGDLVINGRSTKDFKDRDWDAYRNHSIGFVFQSYNLIPHQTVLRNVELALTLSGVSKTERRGRAKKALEAVGLGDQLNKRPAQMSGGQMQRVAIARALVNNPDIILADEPTGALDSETSIQVMEILKEIAKERLVIMVTHNPQLAEKYSTRIVKMLDGKITDDSSPMSAEEVLKEIQAEPKGKKKEKKPSMSFATAFGLSLKNLFTKKGRTILTSFAGSIGIIGIALIYAVSQGFTDYINAVQEDTLSAYPLTIESTTVDLGTIMNTFMNTDSVGREHENDAIYVQSALYDMVNVMNNIETTENDLRSFKEFIENKLAEEGKDGKQNALQQALSGVHYSYDLDLLVYTENVDGTIIKSDSQQLMQELMSEYMDFDMSAMENMAAGSGGGMMSLMTENAMSTGVVTWQEILPGDKGAPINDLVLNQYDLLYGSWPNSYDEIVLVVDENNEVDDLTLYALGLETKEEIAEIFNSAMSGEELEGNANQWSYEEICDLEFRVILNSSCYSYDKTTDTYKDLRDTETGMKYLYENALKLKVSGVIRPSEDGGTAMLHGAIGYLTDLTEYVIEESRNAEVVQAQLDKEMTDIFTGLPFNESTGALTDAQKAKEFKEYVAELSDEDKAEVYVEIMSIPSAEQLEQMVAQAMQQMSREDMEETLLTMFSQQMSMDEKELQKYIEDMEDEEIEEIFSEIMAEQVKRQYAAQVQQQMAALTMEQKYMALAAALPTYTDEQAAIYYEEIMEFSKSSFENNLTQLGYIDLEEPDKINLYASSFENKDVIEEVIADYNKTVDEISKITYTDYIGLMMSSITKIIDTITYVLISFVAISLIVSSIMIGVITLISVQERTKEIGILRALGASKRDVSSMFNAETMIIGFASGLVGVGITYLLCIPIDAIVLMLTKISYLKTNLPLSVSCVLIVISMLLTLFAGIIPSRSAAKKDPVVALRTE